MILDKEFSEILKQATAIKKEKGTDEAIGFLIYIYKDYELDDYSLFQLLSKLKTYAPKSKKYSRDTIVQLFDEVTNKVTNPIYKVDCLEQFGDLYNRYNLPTEAESYISAAISNLNPNFASNYLYKAFELYRQRALTIRNTDRSQEKKDIDYLYYFLCGELLRIAWDLFVPGKQNADGFFIYQQGYIQPTFIPFTYHNEFVKRLKDSNYPFEEGTYEEEALYRLCKGKNFDKYVKLFQDMAVNRFPTELRFKPEFFLPNFRDFREFAIAFANEDNEIIFEKFVPSKAIAVADDIVNEVMSAAHNGTD